MATQLFSLMPPEFRLPSHVKSDMSVASIGGVNIPFMYEPDGMPCIEANAYMLELRRRNLSVRNRGGTLRQYALNISPLLRFCHNNGIRLFDLTDNTFTLFIKSLQGERNRDSELVRARNETIKIGRSCVDFLFFAQSFWGTDELIGPDGAIKIQQKKVSIHVKGRVRKIERTYWHHSSFPQPSPIKKRHPISGTALERLKEAARSAQDRGIRKRKECLISALEQTGGRREEVANLDIRDIEKALKTPDAAPLLRMITVKKKAASERYVPVPRAALDQWSDYIRTTRRKVIARTLGEKNDHNMLFVSHTTGTPLTADTVTTEISKLRLIAGIVDKAHPHLFRHRYITEKLKAMILLHELENKDDFRKALLNVEQFKQKLLEWTGHSDIASLEPYIDFAFGELAGTPRVYNAVALTAAADVALDRIDNLISDAVATGDSKTVLRDLMSLLVSLKQDIQDSRADKV